MNGQQLAVKEVISVSICCSGCKKWTLGSAKLVDLPGLAEDESEFKPRLRLAIDSERPTIHAITLGGIRAG